jgi:ribosomal protein L40E
MTQETVGYVELEWTCKRCGSKNPGSNTLCASCGAAMGEQDQFELPEQPVLVTFAPAATASGSDVHCPYCGGRSPAGSKNCAQCGADLTDAKAREAGQVIGTFQAGPVPDVACPYCGTPNPATALKCRQCSGSLAKPSTARPAPASTRPTPTATGRGLKLGIGVAALVAMLCLCGIVFAALGRTTDAPGVVQALNWERSIEIKEQRPVTREDWQDEIPSGASRGTCERKVRRVQAEPAPGADKVCSTPYVIDQGSGQGKVVQDCQYKVYDNWCKYTANEWQVVDRAAVSGNDANVRWPDTRLKPNQREGDRAEKYQVTFAANDQRYTYTPKDAAEFAQFTLGSRWTLKINALGGVGSVQPAR